MNVSNIIETVNILYENYKEQVRKTKYFSNQWLRFKDGVENIGKQIKDIVGNKLFPLSNGNFLFHNGFSLHELEIYEWTN